MKGALGRRFFVGRNACWSDDPMQYLIASAVALLFGRRTFRQLIVVCWSSRRCQLVSVPSVGAVV